MIPAPASAATQRGTIRPRDENGAEPLPKRAKLGVGHFALNGNNGVPEKTGTVVERSTATRKKGGSEKEDGKQSLGRVDPSSDRGWAH